LSTTPESSFQYHGDLSQAALPEVLHTIDRFGVPGVIEAEQGSIKKRVFIKEGNVVHAASSDREDSLGRYLESSGVLGPTQYDLIMRDRSSSKKRLGVLLAEQGILSPAEVNRAIRKQIESIVWSLFYWMEGSITFSIGEFRAGDDIRIQLPMRQVILQGIKRAPNAKAMVGRLGRKETVFEPCYRMEELIELAIDADDFRLLKLVDGQRSLYEVCTQGPHSAGDNGKVLYAFQVLQVIRRVVTTQGEPTKKVGETTGAIRIRFKTSGDTYSGD
jgi:hypothetical protein